MTKDVASALLSLGSLLLGEATHHREKLRPPASSQLPAPTPHPWERAVWDAGPPAREPAWERSSPLLIASGAGPCATPTQRSCPHTPSPQKPRENVPCRLRPLRFGAVCSAAIDRYLIQPLRKASAPRAGPHAPLGLPQSAS